MSDEYDPQQSAPDGQAYYIKSCPGEGTEVVLLPEGGGGGGGPAVDPELLAERAVDRLTLPAPRIGMNPVGRQYTQIQTWLWLEGGWTEQSASASAGSVTTTAAAKPTKVVWDMGGESGESVTCDGPGTPWTGGDVRRPEDESPTCGHTYRYATPGDETYQAEVTVHWSVSWQASGAPGGGELPGMTSSTTFEVDVDEIRTVLTDKEGLR